MTSARTALITGVGGQDGTYAARLLLARGYRVVGTSRQGPGPASDPAVEHRQLDLASLEAVCDLVAAVRPSEIYNFAAYSTGSGMFDDPVALADINGLAPLRLLEAIRRVDPTIRLCQASSSEMFGPLSPAPQSERTRLDPRSPYGMAKQLAHQAIGLHRQHHGLFACSAILFNHESPLRSSSFVTRKVTRAAARISVGLEHRFSLGTLDARRDWSFAGDTVRAMWMMLQADAPRDYVVASGRTHSIADLCRTAFEHLGLDYRHHLQLGPMPPRPRGEFDLVGDPTSLRDDLGWRPSMSFAELIASMVDADVAAAKAETETDA